MHNFSSVTSVINTVLSRFTFAKCRHFALRRKRLPTPTFPYVSTTWLESWEAAIASTPSGVPVEDKTSKKSQLLSMSSFAWKHSSELHALRFYKESTWRLGPIVLRRLPCAKFFLKINLCCTHLNWIFWTSQQRICDLLVKLRFVKRSGPHDG